MKKLAIIFLSSTMAAFSYSGSRALGISSGKFYISGLSL